MANIDLNKKNNLSNKIVDCDLYVAEAGEAAEYLNPPTNLFP